MSADSEYMRHMRSGDGLACKGMLDLEANGHECVGVGVRGAGSLVARVVLGQCGRLCVG